MTIHKVAIIQLYPKPLRVEDNHRRACTLIREAASCGAVLAVLPEFHLTGYFPEEPAFAICASNYKSYLESYCFLAAELQINIVPGTIVEAHRSSSCPISCPSCSATESTSPRLLNVAYFISATGTILGSYQKVNLWHGERAHLSSGLPANSSHHVISTPLGPVGLLACWDLAVPEASRALVAQGVKIIIIPASWPGLGSAPAGLKRNPGFEKLMLQSLLTARAFENSCAVVFVNVGNEDNDRNLGLSQVVMPFSGTLGAPLGSGEAIAVIDLDMSEIGEAEEYYKVREGLNRDEWMYGFLGKSERE